MQRYALLRDSEEPFDARPTASVLSGVTNNSEADLVAWVGRHPGILLENLGQEQADRCAKALTAAGIPVRIVAHDAIVEPPEPLQLRKAQIIDDRFDFGALRESGACRWEDIVWLDLVHIAQHDTEEYEDWEVVGSRYGTEFRTRKQKRTVTSWDPRLEIIAERPLRWLRIKKDEFEFANTGLVVHSNRKQNLMALAIALASRASVARLGVGLAWVRDDNETPEDYLVPTDKIYRNLLRWELTRM